MLDPTIIIPEGFSTGLAPRNFDDNPLGSFLFATKFPDDELVPLDQIVETIKIKEQNEATLLHVWKKYVNVVLDQNGLGYCHAFSPTMAIMVLRAVQNLNSQLLSASSVGGPVTRYTNNGAYIFDDLKQIIKGGVAPAPQYPMTTAKNSWTPELKELALLTRVEEWWEGDNRMDHQVISCLLTDKPVCVGYNWWGHAVTLLWVTVVGNTLYYIGINSWRNSWSYGMEVVPQFNQLLGGGFFCFPVGTINGGTIKLGMYGKNKGTPDEWYAPRSIKTSNVVVAA